MFDESTFTLTKELTVLAEDVKSKLDSKKIKFEYPVILIGKKISDNEWEKHVLDIDERNKKIINSIKGKAGVYAIYTSNPALGNAPNCPSIDLNYIGQTDDRGAKNRIRSHLVWRNKNTKSGRYTGSKFDEVKASIEAGKEIHISFCAIYPKSLRHYVEEILFDLVKDGWNKHGKRKNKIV